MSLTLPSLPQAVDVDESRPLHTYAIVDCAHLDGLFYQETEKDPDIVCQSLLAGTIYEKSAIAGPLLIQVTPPHNVQLEQTLLKIEAENPAVVWLWSTDTFAELHPRLQALQFVEREAGKKLFLRYFDPRNLETTHTIFRTNSDSRPFLANIQGWAHQRNGQYHYLT
jgi:hypothetical protein